MKRALPLKTVSVPKSKAKSSSKVSNNSSSNSSSSSSSNNSQDESELHLSQSGELNTDSVVHQESAGCSLSSVSSPSDENVKTMLTTESMLTSFSNYNCAENYNNS